MPGVNSANLLIDFDLTSGIRLGRIFDVVAQRDYLPAPSMLFEFAANNGPAFQSDTGLSAVRYSQAVDGSALSVSARSNDQQIEFGLSAAFASDSAVALFQLTAKNLTPSPIFLRVVMPKIFGVNTPGDPVNMMGAIPQEGGSVVPLSPAHRWGAPTISLGMPFILDVGLPNARNHMEVVSIFDCSMGGGVFFCDMDGDLDNGVAPLQFNLSPTTVGGIWSVDGFWIGNLQANAQVKLPRLAIGVHSDGDWHKAVDYYTLVHRPRWNFPSTPAWFREACAIYCPTGGGAGGIYLSLPIITSLADGAIWTSWKDGNGPFRTGSLGDPWPVQVSPAGFTPAGSALLAVKQNSNQVTVFAAGFNGAIQATWESGDGPWHNNRNGLIPARITPQNYVTPGIPLACGQQGDNQLDVFFVRDDGSLWVTWESGDGVWTDGETGRYPAQIAPAGYAPGGAYLAVAKQNASQLDLFVIGVDGAIWAKQVVGFGAWSEGVAITPPQMFPPGAPLVAIWQNETQLNLFAVDKFGTIQTTWKNSDSPWPNQLIAVSPTGIAAPGGCLAAAKQSASQLDVFFVRQDGAIWVTWEVNDGPWTDGSFGRSPVPITPGDFAIAGSPLAVANLGQDLRVFFVGTDGTIFSTFTRGEDSPWSDGLAGRPGPQQVTPRGFVPKPGVAVIRSGTHLGVSRAGSGRIRSDLPNLQPGLAAIARSDTHLDIFCAGSGRMRSFLDLPNLLAEAQGLGTNILYLMDYWEGTDQGEDVAYANKGDYRPRLDLGGEGAFIAGIDAVHQLGGRVLLYLESFIIYQYSCVGLENGEAWGGRDELDLRWGLDRFDQIYPNYPGYYTMIAPFGQWQDHVVETAERLVAQYKADGIMLDSCAWQMNRPMHNQAENISYSAQDYSKGVLDLVGRVRVAVQKINSDAIVIGETTAGPIARHWDGGLSADLGFGNIWGKDGPQRLTASPVRYGIPEVRMFGNGLNIGGLHQIFAAGHGLALCSNFPGGGFMFDNAAHIQKLVQIRVTYRDALIHGAQINQPRADNPQVVAYQYQGSTHRIVTIVNLGDTNAKARVSLDSPDPGGKWVDLLGQGSYRTKSGVLENVALTTGQGSLLVLLNTYDRGSLSSATRRPRVHVSKDT
jgi:hypothetical protein